MNKKRLLKRALDQVQSAVEQFKAGNVGATEYELSVMTLLAITGKSAVSGYKVYDMVNKIREASSPVLHGALVKSTTLSRAFASLRGIVISPGSLTLLLV